MLSDLFTIFDYSWGTGFTFLRVSMWLGGFMLPLFILSFLVYWYSPSIINSFLIGFVRGFRLKIPGEVKWIRGTPHIFLTLLLVLLTLNISGSLPYHYPLSSHFFIIGRFAFSFWFRTVFVNLRPNLRLLFIGLIQEGGYLIPNVIVIFSEIIRFLARPVTLIFRLTINIIIGQIITRLIRGVFVGFFFWFFWYENRFNLSYEVRFSFLINCFTNYIFYPLIYYRLKLLPHCLILLRVIFMFMVEVVVSFLQAFIFAGLLLFYVYEVPLKLK